MTTETWTRPWAKNRPTTIEYDTKGNTTLTKAAVTELLKLAGYERDAATPKTTEDSPYLTTKNTAAGL